MNLYQNSKTLNGIAGIRGIILFIVLFLLCGQVIAFFNEELNGFLFIPIYFVLFPLLSLTFIFVNILLMKTSEIKLKHGLIAIVFFLLYGFFVFLQPNIGVPGFFISDYRTVNLPFRLCILVFTIIILYLSVYKFFRKK